MIWQRIHQIKSGIISRVLLRLRSASLYHVVVFPFSRQTWSLQSLVAI
jgi:hypothetical protein